MIHLFSSPQRRAQGRFYKWLGIISLVISPFTHIVFLLFAMLFAVCSLGAYRKARIQDQHYAHMARVMKEAA